MIDDHPLIPLASLRRLPAAHQNPTSMGPRHSSDCIASIDLNKVAHPVIWAPSLRPWYLPSNWSTNPAQFVGW
jgi:hypothetical protein